MKKCEGCNKISVDFRKYWLFVDYSEMDPCGNCDTYYEEADLCKPCYNLFLNDAEKIGGRMFKDIEEVSDAIRAAMVDNCVVVFPRRKWTTDIIRSFVTKTFVKSK